MVASSPGDEPLVAREAELNHVLAALGAVAKGKSGRLVLLTGEPGIGKTRLLVKVLARAQEEGNLVLVGRSFEQHTSVPFFPFNELLGAGWREDLKTQRGICASS
jgi:predicted ATPase